MAIHFCESCGSLLKGQVITCTGCGAKSSKHSSSMVQSEISHAALTVSPRFDPLVIERTVNQIIYGTSTSFTNGSTNYDLSQPGGALVESTTTWSAQTPERPAPTPELPAPAPEPPAPTPELPAPAPELLASPQNPPARTANKNAPSTDSYVKEMDIATHGSERSPAMLFPAAAGGVSAPSIEGQIANAIISQYSPENTESKNAIESFAPDQTAFIPVDESAVKESTIILEPKTKPQEKKPAAFVGSGNFFEIAPVMPAPPAAPDDLDTTDSNFHPAEANESIENNSIVELSKPQIKASESKKEVVEPQRKIAKRKREKKDDDHQLLGFRISKSVLVTSVALMLVIGFPSLVLIVNVISLIGGATNNPSAAQQSTSNAGQATAASINQPSAAQGGMTGNWLLSFENGGGRIGQGSFSLVQNGDQIQGWGQDTNGQFQIAGRIQNDSIVFTKAYVQAGQAVGKPIQYAATLRTIASNNGGVPVLQMNGEWQVTKREGYSWRAKIVTLKGRFEAHSSNSTEPIANGAAPGFAPAGTVTAAAVAQTPGEGGIKDPKKAQNFFLQVAIGIVGIGVVLAMLSLRFFGPSGLLNIWAKKEYIPSQFKAQHFKMVREMGKPVSTGGIPLGKREEWGLHQFWLPRHLCMPATLREKNPHLFILGAGATGKTRLMASMIAQDIKSGDRAVVLVDSDGGLADLILDWIASQPDGKALSKRVIVVDPTDGGKSLCYNPLEFPENEDLQNAASAIAFGFKAAYTEPPGSQSQWNQQTANILRNSAVLLMANGRTLTDLPVLLSDNDFRDVMLQHVEQVKHQRAEYITLIDAWANYKRLARTDQWITWIEPILNRVQPMLSDPRLRAILTKAKSELDLRQMISEKQILIVKIPQGQLDKNGNLLGSLMVAGIKQAALSLSSKSRKKHPCSLYLDEFESFIEKETFDTITSETRKLQIAFCGASKSLQTMPEDFRNKIIINVGMMAVFALAKKDADMIGPQMFRVDGRKVKHQTIQNVFNKVNSSPQFELIMDEEKLNIDRVVGQEKRTYFCYRVGSVAGVFRLKAPDFADIDPAQVNKALLTNMRTNRQEEEDAEEEEDEDAEEVAEADDNDGDDE